MAKKKRGKKPRKTVKTPAKSGKSKLNMPKLHRFIEQTAKKAGKLAKKDFRKLKLTDTWSKKGVILPSLVTKTDHTVELFLLSELWHYAKDNGLVFKVLAEEGGSSLINPKHKKSKPDLTWHVDPIDGTTNFVFGTDFYAVSIAAEKNGKIIAGAVYAPERKEMYIAKDGKSYLNGKRLQVKNRVAPRVRRINGSISRTIQNMRYLKRLIMKYKVAIKSCASLSTCEVAAGRVDASVHLTPKSWDVAAANAVLEGAGGVATDIKGRKWVPKDMATIAANKEFIKELIAVLNKKIKK